MWHSLPAAPLNGFLQQAEQGPLSSCLPACIQAKPARLEHLHKRQPRRVHMQTHTAWSTQTQPLLHISCARSRTQRQAELVGLRERLYKKIVRSLFEVPVFMSSEDRSDLSECGHAILEGNAGWLAMLECRCPARHYKCHYSDLFSSRGSTH